jgi:thiol-disulfide isomerase/thioredoxin
MCPLASGDAAPPLPGVGDGAHAVFFYKVTCPTCQMAAPAAERLFRSFPDRFVAVGQDPPERIDAFAAEYGTSFSAISEPPPYELSTAYRISSVPTLVLVEDGRVLESVESWNRDAWNALAARLGDLAGVGAEPLSHPGDGLPPFRPG